MKHERETIIRQGQEIFRIKGYHATGVSTILKECGISKGTFYNYFQSKEQFALEALSNYSEQMKKLIKTYMSFASMSPAKRLKRYFEQLIKINNQEGATNGCLLMNFMVELAGNRSAFALATKQEFEKWISLLAPTIEKAQENREITNAYTSKQIAEFMYIHLYGDFARMKSVKSTILMEAQLRMVFELLEQK